MTSILLVIQILLAIIITIAVLLQKSSSIGLGVYSGSNESLFGAKGPAGFMAKFTMVVGLVFIVNTIALGYFYNKETSKSVMDSKAIQMEQKESTNDNANPLDNFSAPKSPFGELPNTQSPSPFEKK